MKKIIKSILILMSFSLIPTSLSFSTDVFAADLTEKDMKEVKTELESMDERTTYINDLINESKKNPNATENERKVAIKKLDAKKANEKRRNKKKGTLSTSANVYSFYYLTWAEKVFASQPWNWSKAQKAQQIAVESFNRSNSSTFGYSHDRGEDDHKDAFRHSQWNEWMACDLGYNDAIYISDLHESESYGKSKDMDLHNNRQGANRACQGPWALKNAMKNGSMRVFPAYNNGWYLWSTWY